MRRRYTLFRKYRTKDNGIAGGKKGKQFVWDKLLRQTLLRNDINANRLYVFGISEGGYGSQRLSIFSMPTIGLQQDLWPVANL